MSNVRTKTSKLAFHDDIVCNTITMGDHTKLQKEELSGFEENLKLVCLSTGIDESKIIEMKAADYNTLVSDCLEFIQTGSHVLTDVEITPKLESYQLMVPFDSGTGEKISEVKLKMPTVKHSRALADIEKVEDKGLFVFHSVTGFHKEDIDSLSTNDYVTLNDVISNFFYENASFFSTPTK